MTLRLSRKEEDFVLLVGREAAKQTFSITKAECCRELKITEEEYDCIVNTLWPYKDVYFACATDNSILPWPASIQWARQIQAQREAASRPVDPATQAQNWLRRTPGIGHLVGTAEALGPLVGFVGGVIGLVGGLLGIIAMLRGC